MFGILLLPFYCVIKNWQINSIKIGSSWCVVANGKKKMLGAKNWTVLICLFNNCPCVWSKDVTGNKNQKPSWKNIQVIEASAIIQRYIGPRMILLFCVQSIAVAVTDTTGYELFTNYHPKKACNQWRRQLKFVTWWSSFFFSLFFFFAANTIIGFRLRLGL